ncbi:MAG TPA: hypothetical protein VGJ94_12840 [Syntrophorhabdaceae bacterium]
MKEILSASLILFFSLSLLGAAKSATAESAALSDPEVQSEPAPGQSMAITGRPFTYALDANASGIIRTINNIATMTVVSRDANDLRAEYRAGFVQGRLQDRTIHAARDNSWDNSYLIDPSHTFPAQPGPTGAELNEAAGYLNANYVSFLQYLTAPATDPVTAHRLKRLLFRMLGIYHGVALDQPAELDFSGNWLPGDGYFQASELALGYETGGLTFMDVYFLNAYCDLMDVISYRGVPPGGMRPGNYPDRCSAFLKRLRREVILAHNTWMGYLSQTMAQTLSINGDLVTFNGATPGLIGSYTDFGYNNKGILFTETTLRAATSQVKPLGLWTFWLAAMAEQFAGSISEFFDALSLDNTGTYLNGYMLVDAKTNETALVEMSYRCFVYYRSTGGPYTVTSRSLDGNPCSTEYDGEMVTPDYLMGINYPASLQIRSDLLSTDNRPARREQFKRLLPRVTDLAGARRAITYRDPKNPLSIFGRWDPGYGETDDPKQIPDGAVDAKAASTSMVRSFMKLSGTLNIHAGAHGFWMLYGTPFVKGRPFIWSRSLWSWQKLRDVPDRLTGSFTLIPLYLK